MGIQTGRRLATIGDPIINPNNLQVIAWYATGNLIGFSPAVIFSEDIHELGHLGAIIDSADNILPLDDLARLQEILSYNFSLYNLPVFDKSGRKLGVVKNFNFDSDDFLIKQIIVKPTLGVRLTSPFLIIYRNQIIEINNKKLIVDSSAKVIYTPRQADVKKSPVPES